MSRSYKKFASFKEFPSCIWGKRCANRRVRHYKGEIARGSAYKKLYERWDICDYSYVNFFAKPNDKNYRK